MNGIIDKSGYCSVHKSYHCECSRLKRGVPLISRCEKHHRDYSISEGCPECSAGLPALESVIHIAGEPGNRTMEEVAKEFDPNGKAPGEPGCKLDGGKPLAGVLGDFALALMEVAKVGTYGAGIYSRGGWQSVPDAETRYHDAEWRHLLKRRHEDCDKDSGLLHDAHRAWNVLAQLELRLRKDRSGDTLKRFEEMMFPKDVTWNDSLAWKDGAPGCPHTRTKFVATSSGDFRQCLGCGARLESA